MTEDQMIEDQEVELHDDDNEVVEEAHDPKNAEAQSVASVDKAGDATGSAPLPTSPGATANKATKKDAMPKTKAALMAAMMNNMGSKNKEMLKNTYENMMK